MENPYVTYHDDYIESEWWALKQMWDKGLLYQGHKVMPYCPRCGTALSSHEVAQGYKDVQDLTCTCKFKVEGEKNVYFLAWTTTPWTLPSNLALCVNKAYTYAYVKVERPVIDGKMQEEGTEEIYILAKDLIGAVLKDIPYEIVKEVKGSELLGMKYEQLMPFAKPEGKAFVVIHGDYVTLTDGTGIVHIAPAYGEDDSLVAKQNGIAFVNLVDKSGNFVKEVEPWAGRFVRDCNEDICKWLANENKLFSKEKHVHSYPHCWRCDTPLLYYPKESWFVKMSSLRDELVANNNKVNWYPDTIRTGRFGKFLENVIDWGISRDRYWGTPLPVWKCDCGHLECIGSIEELKEKIGMNGVRIVGNPEDKMKRVAIVAHLYPNSAMVDEIKEDGYYHSYDMEIMKYMETENIDAIIPGEIIEWTILSYIRDAAYMGKHKACFNIGHFNMEELGMKYAADWIGELLNNEIPVNYIPTEDGWTFL